MFFAKVAILATWFTLGIAQGCTPLQTMDGSIGLQVTSVRSNTTGLALFFNDINGPSAHDVCIQLSDGPCSNLVQSVGNAIGVALLAVGSNVTSASAANLTTRAVAPDFTSRLQAYSSSIGYEYHTPRAGSTRIHARSDGVTPHNHDMIVQHSAKGNGTVTIVSNLDHSSKRDVVAGDPNPGIKVSYTTYPSSFAPVIITSQDASILGQEMATNWAADAAVFRNRTQYIGLFENTWRMIVAFQIIPEIRGFGLNWEDPNQPCGDLGEYACFGIQTSSACFDVQQGGDRQRRR